MERGGVVGAALVAISLLVAAALNSQRQRHPEPIPQTQAEQTLISTASEPPAGEPLAAPCGKDTSPHLACDVASSAATTSL